MSEPATHSPGSSDGLGRWLLGGLAAGAAILGLLIAAYAIGYHRGQNHPNAAATTVPPGTSTAAATTTNQTTTAPTTTGPVPVTAALVTRGKKLYTADGCSACHSLTGSAGAGPTWKGLAGSQVKLANGQTATADDAYLTDKIADPAGTTVAGYTSGIMAAAIASYDLASKPTDIRALVAFIKSQR